MKHNEWDDCFLLHQRAHGETSLIVDMFTRTNGKISLIAKNSVGYKNLLKLSSNSYLSIEKNEDPHCRIEKLFQKC